MYNELSSFAYIYSIIVHHIWSLKNHSIKNINVFLMDQFSIHRLYMYIYNDAVIIRNFRYNICVI